MSVLHPGMVAAITVFATVYMLCTLGSRVSFVMLCMIRQMQLQIKKLAWLNASGTVRSAVVCLTTSNINHYNLLISGSLTMLSGTNIRLCPSPASHLFVAVLL